MAAAINIEPGASAFAASGGKASHQIVSVTDARLAFKVFFSFSLHSLIHERKLFVIFGIQSEVASNNDHYRVHPVYGFLEPKTSAKLDIVRSAGPPKEDKIVVQWAEVPAEEADPQAPFKAGAQAGEVILPLKAE